jgi:hypothetical protein
MPWETVFIETLLQRQGKKIGYSSLVDRLEVPTRLRISTGTLQSKKNALDVNLGTRISFADVGAIFIIVGDSGLNVRCSNSLDRIPLCRIKALGRENP